MSRRRLRESPASAPSLSAEVAEGGELHRAVHRGTRAALVAQAASQLTSLVVLGILCRWVAPREFGVFNTALLIVTLPRMFATLGLTAATIQRPHLSAGELSALFRLQLALGLGSAVFSAVLGSLLAWLVAAADVGRICLLLSGTSLCAALGAQHQALLERHLRLRRVVGMRLAAQLLAGGVAVGAALGGAEMSALVLQQYVELVALAVLAWASEPWRPTRDGSGVEWRAILKLGGDVSLTNLCFYVAQNSDKLLLFLTIGGTSAGQAVLGMYNLAFNLMMKPVYVVTTPVTGVMLPALSRAASRPETYGQLAIGFYRLVAIALTPCGLGLWLVADDVTSLLAGPRWGDAGLLLATLAPTILVQGFINLVGSLLTSAGRTRSLLAGAGVVALLQMQGHLAGCYFGQAFWQTSEPSPGLAAARGVAIAYSCVLIFIVAVPYLLYACRQAGISPREILRAVRPSLLASAGMGLVVWGVRQALDARGPWPPTARLTLCVLVGVAVYVTLARREIRAALRVVPDWTPSRDATRVVE